jgi:hypothetical protein
MPHRQGMIPRDINDARHSETTAVLSSSRQSGGDHESQRLHYDLLWFSAVRSLLDEAPEITLIASPTAGFLVTEAYCTAIYLLQHLAGKHLTRTLQLLIQDHDTKIAQENRHQNKAI